MTVTESGQGEHNAVTQNHRPEKTQNSIGTETTATPEGALLLDGTATARTLRAEVAQGVAALKAARGVTAHLAAVLIGADPASETYVGMKQKSCRWVGMDSSIHRLPADTTQAEAEALVERLNADPNVSGILVQHPVPKHLHEPAILDRVSVEKDVDGISR